MKLALVILNYNGKKLLEQFLGKFVAHSSAPNHHIYVVDNASTDDSISYVRKSYPSVSIIQNKENYGFAKGYNEALKAIDCDIYALVNSDIEVTPNWITPILDEFQSNPDTAAAQPKLLDFKQKNHFEYAGAAGGFIDQFGYPFCRGRVFDTCEKDQRQYDTNTTIFWASGACFFVRKAIFDTLNGFDEYYFAHQEEIDLCWRIQQLNMEIKCISTSEVYHVGGATLNAAHPKKTFLNFRNSLFTLTKNLPKNKLVFVIFIRLCLDGIAALRFLFQLKPRHTVAILKAHFAFYMRLNYYLGIRGSAAKKEDYYEVKSAVYQYFIKGKKTYTALKNS